MFPGLHPAIERFVKTGALEAFFTTRDGRGFEHAFAYVAKTGVGRQFGVRETGSRLFVSGQFGETVVLGEDSDVADNFVVSSI
jgi:hypothetical protein